MSMRKERGVAAIEMALMSIFLLLLGGGIAEFGHALYTYDTLAKSARAGARYIAIRDLPDDTVARGEAQNVALCGLPACAADAAVVPGLSTTHILVETPSNNNRLANVSTGATTGSVDLVSVTISPPNAPYAFQPWVAIPFFGALNFNFGPIHVTMPRTS